MISMANCFQIISKGVVLFILLFSFNELFAAEGGPCKDYGECDKFQYSLNDIESLQRGASTYINYCYGCHSLKYSRWGRVAKDCLLYTSPSPRDDELSRMPSSA